MMEKAGEEIGVNLAVSLHAVTKEIRDEIVPINRKYGIEELLQACADYPGANNARRITFEYVMLKDKNDSDEDARELVRLIKQYKLPAKVNLIPFNPWPGAPYECSSPNASALFSNLIFEAWHQRPGAHPARARHHGGVRPAEIGSGEKKPRRAGPAGRGKAGGPGLPIVDGGSASPMQIRLATGSSPSRAFNRCQLARRGLSMPRISRFSG
jgi:hypothetical protein